MGKCPPQTSNAANITSETCKHQKRTLLEQIGLHLEKQTENLWVYENDEMVYRSISYVPDLYKIFEFIFVNAADIIQRYPWMDSVKVTIDPEGNTVSVFINGRSAVLAGIHQEENVSDATWLTKNNFCTEFVIEAADGLLLKKSKQVFTNHIEREFVQEITKCKASEYWTKLTFKPNLEKFKMAYLEDVVALMKKHVLDMAECLGKTVKVELNDQLVRIIESFEHYADLCIKSAEKSRPVNAIELALSEEKAVDRNTWNHNFEPGKELILFSSADLKRSIPSVVDGLKPDQRKVLFCAFKRKLYEEINVCQFIGYVSQHFACHNGEESLACTIVEMAQDFVGSNNINLLKPNGQFGTRGFGGKDHASVGCLYTELNPVTRYLFHEDDDKLGYLNEDGRSIEPNWYIPIIPLVLVNGSGGFGAGWSSIPCYSPLDIIANVKCLLTNEDMKPMVPCYRRFNGKIEETAKKGEYRVSGCTVDVDEQSFRITELPIGMWTEDYKEFLESIADWSPNVKDPLIEEFTHNVESYANVDIKIKMKPDKIALLRQKLDEKFKLISTVNTNNMHLFDAEGKIKKFDDPEQILKEFYALRLPYYKKRKENILANLQESIVILDNISRFISEFLNGNIILINRPKGELLLELQKKRFTSMRWKGKSAEPQVAGANDYTSEAQEDDNNKEEGTWGGYEYLIFIPLKFFTFQNVDKLLAKKMKKMEEYHDLEKRSCSEMWMMDLDELEKKLVEIKEAEEERKRSSQAGKTAKTQNVEPENDNTSMEVENVVGVTTKPKGRAGSKKTQKDSVDDYITSLEECLDAYNFKSFSSCEITGAMETEEPPLPAAAKKRKVGFGIDVLR